MRVLHWIGLAAFLWNMALFVLAIRRGFARPEGMPPLMRVLSAVGLVSLAADALLITFATSTQAVWQLSAGLALLALSQWLFRSALSAMQEAPLSLAFSEDAPSFLLQRGPYRWVRHPFYTAYTLSWLAVVVITTHALAAVVLLLMGTLYVCAAVQEERKFLGSALASDYRAYRQRTGMFLPSINSHPSYERRY